VAFQSQQPQLAPEVFPKGVFRPEVLPQGSRPQVVFQPVRAAESPGQARFEGAWARLAIRCDRLTASRGLCMGINRLRNDPKYML